MTYGVLLSEFWSGVTGRALRGDPASQVVALNLLSSRLANMLGLFYLPLEIVAHETGIKHVSRCLDRLSVEGFAFYDAASEVVWVTTMARVRLQLARGELLHSDDKRLPSLKKLYLNLPDNKFLGAFYDHYAEALHLDTRRDSQGTPKGLDSPSPSEQNRTSTRSSIGSSAEHPTRGLPARGVVDDGFLDFWKAYPKKKAQPEARKAWKGLNPSADCQQRILAAIERQRREADWLRESGRFIPYPATWLRAHRWLDEPVRLPAVSDRTIRTMQAVAEADALAEVQR
jgi:hypothetical protein